jgi:heme/copper-type cytochrome/quinol oxidase subunit 2
MNRDRKKSIIKFGMALFLLSLVLVTAGAQDQSSYANDSAEPAQEPAQEPTKPAQNRSADVWFAGGIVVIVFLLLIFMGYMARDRGSLGTGEMRRAIAGTFVAGFTIIVVLSYTYEVCQKEIVFAYI